MKTKLLSLILIASFATASCTTLNKVSTIGARRGTYETLKRHPEYRPAFEAGVVALDNLLLKETVDYEGLIAALQVLKINEIKGSDGAALLRDVIDVYDALIGDTARKKTPEQLRGWAQAIRDGVSQGLAQFTAPTPPLPPST